MSDRESEGTEELKHWLKKSLIKLGLEIGSVTVKSLCVKVGMVDDFFFSFLNKDQKDLHEEDEIDRQLKNFHFFDEYY